MVLIRAGGSRADSGDGTGLETSVSADVVGRTGNAGSGPDDRLDVRSAELVLYGPSDHLFDGRVSLAAHTESTGAYVEIHEAYVGSSRLIPRTRFRLGQFFLGIGRLNRTHQHEWPFVSAPKTHRDFFDDEGVLDTGLEVSTLLPTPFVWDLTVGVTNGWVFGHSHTLGSKPDWPTHYIRSAHYASLPGNGGVEFGLNYLGRRNESETHFHYLGLDTTAKWRESKILRFLVQSEIWARIISPKGLADEYSLGGYVFPQFGWNSEWSLGIRGDFYSVLSLENALGGSVNNGTFAAVPTLTYKPSEFTTFRAAYTFEYDNPSAIASSFNHGVEIQATFILGGHQAHDHLDPHSSH